MKLLRCLLLLPLVAFTAADTWQPFVVDKRVSVQFPGQPQEMNLAALAAGRNAHHAQMWYVQTLEATYSVSRSSNKEVLAPSDTLKRRRYYSRVIEAILQDEQGQLVEYAFFPTTAGQGVDFKYKGLHKVTKQRITKFLRCLVVDSISYALNFRAMDKTDTSGVTSTAQRHRFFDSITVKP